MTPGATLQVRWLLLCTGSGALAGVIAAVLALLISGNLYGTGLPDAALWAPLPLVPMIALVALNSARPTVSWKVRLIGLALLATAAASGEFIVAIAIAQADHG